MHLQSVTTAHCSSRLDRLELSRYQSIPEEGLTWTAKVAGKNTAKVVRAEQLARAAKHQVQVFASQFPHTSEVLIMHGTRDEIVPTSAAADFTNTVARNGNRFKLQLIDGSDHNFRG